jgi:hypothetical protein
VVARPECLPSRTSVDQPLDGYTLTNANKLELEAVLGLVIGKVGTDSPCGEIAYRLEPILMEAERINIRDEPV